jgi:hypothetical protein
MLRFCGDSACTTGNTRNEFGCNLLRFKTIAEPEFSSSIV